MLLQRVSLRECCYREGVTTGVLLQRGCHYRSAVIKRESPQVCCFKLTVHRVRRCNGAVGKRLS